MLTDYRYDAVPTARASGTLSSAALSMFPYPVPAPRSQAIPAATGPAMPNAGDVRGLE